MKKRKLRVGIIGAGWPGQQHARAIAESAEAEVYACAEADRTRAEEFQSIFAPQKRYADYRDLLGDPGVDAVVICLPNFLHFPATLAALEASKHVLCEKPPTLNGPEMVLLREEAAKRGLVYFFSRQFRFSPAMRRARELIAEQRLGQIYFAEATWVRSRGIPLGVGGWFTEKARSGGGALIDIGIHALDAAWFLMGTPRPLSVSAAVFQNFPHLVKNAVFDVEDSAFAFVRFANGAVVQLKTSWAGNLTDEIPEGQIFGRELNNCTIYGNKATIRLRPLTLFEDVKGKLVDRALEPADDADSFVLQMQNFLEAIAGRAAPMNSAEQAVYLMEMLDAIYLSSATGREVPIARAGKTPA
ncbi:MAG: Gfo/Idh/MocA family oxidoreductase [Chthoniobacterales bacterium]|nr:Gfo/Idh/MocA family oxidoreductase [Chthoniobacterales bacterium]